MSGRCHLPGLIVLAAIAPLAAHADQLSFGAATGYNVFVFNNFSEYNTDIQGRVAVGGNFTPANGGGMTIASTSTDGAGVYDLVVGGNFTNNGNTMGGGSAWVGGNMTWTSPTLPNNAYVVGTFTDTGGGSVQNGGTIYYAGGYNGPSYLSHQNESASSMPAPINFLAAQTSLESLSNSLAGEAPNGTVNQSGTTYTLSGASSTLNVFNLSASTYTGATINISAPAGSTVVVNVSGTSDSFNGGSINYTGVSSNDVIFNFNSATSLSLANMAFVATILAPTADFTGSGGHVSGQLIANSASGTTEFESNLFTGNLGGTPAVPEPSTWLLLLTGVGTMAMLRRVR